MLALVDQKQQQVMPPTQSVRSTFVDGAGRGETWESLLSVSSSLTELAQVGQIRQPLAATSFKQQNGPYENIRASGKAGRNSAQAPGTTWSKVCNNSRPSQLAQQQQTFTIASAQSVAACRMRASPVTTPTRPVESTVAKHTHPVTTCRDALAFG
jgi:hypothetical protein